MSLCRLAAIALLFALTSAPVRADSAPVDLIEARTAQFCETPKPFDTGSCQWSTVRLPHRWAPDHDGFQWALYRFEWESPPSASLALVAERLALEAQLRVNGTDIVLQSFQSRDDNRFINLRYWPQFIPLGPVSEGNRGEVLRVDVALRGHVDMKNGIGMLALAEQGTAQEIHLRETLVEVYWPLAMAAATGTAGLIGLFCGGAISLAAQLLRVFSVVAILAALRTAMSYVIAPPMSAWMWAGLNHWVLLSISIAVSCGIALYLTGKARQCVVVALLAALGLGMTFAGLPSGRPQFIALELFSVALAIVGIALSIALIRRVIREPDAVGMTLLVGLSVLIIAGVHDLVTHLGPGSQSDRYLQRWTIPLLIILLILMLMRRVLAQRKLETRLAQETGHREELLRNLHDGIGSRLAALAFHSRRHDPTGALGEEIRSLMNELQMIQRAVQAEPSTLIALLADQRHRYAHVGGGGLPLHWDIADDAGNLLLNPIQALATLRILDEAIANAMKHANPSQITIRLQPSGDRCAVLRVSDDGTGSFKAGLRGGLNNMRIRAEQAGFGFGLEQAPNEKSVVLTYCDTVITRSRLQRFRRAGGTRPG